MSVQVSRVADYWEELVMLVILIVGTVWAYREGGVAFLSFFVVLWFILGIWVYELMRRIPI